MRETIPTPGADPRAKILAAADAAVYPSSKTRLLLEQIDEGEPFFGIEALAPAFHARDGAALRLPARGRALSSSRIPRRWSKRRAGRRAELREAAASPARRAPPGARRGRVRAGRGRGARRRWARAGGWRSGRSRWRGSTKRRRPRRACGSRRRRTPRCAPSCGTPAPAPTCAGHDDAGRRRQAAARSPARLAGDLGQRVRLVAPNRTHADRLAALLRALGPRDLGPRARRAGGSASASTAGRSAGGPVGPLRRGFRAAGRSADRRRRGGDLRRALAPRGAPGQPRRPALGDLGEIAEGDVVVHDEHGIGRYRGLKKLTVRGVPQDFLQLEYDGGIGLPAGLPHRPRPPLQRRRGGRRPARQAGRQDLAREAAARLGRGAQDRRGAAAALRAARRAGRPRLPRARRRLPRVRGDVPVRRDARSGEGHRDRARRHAERRADGPPDLRRRRLRQDRGGAARDAAGRAGRQAGRGPGADDGARRAALRDLLRALRRLPGARGGAVALSHQGGAAGDAGGARRGEARRRRRHAPHPVARRALQGPRPPGRRRGAALRRHAQGAAQGAAHAGRRAHADRDADPAHAADGDGRPARDLDHRDAARRSAGDPHLRLPVRSGAPGRGARAGARARRPDLLRPQPRRGHRRGGREDPRDLAGRHAHRHRPRPDARRRAREGDGRLRRRPLRHPRLHDDHRVGPRHPARQHDDRQPRRPLRPGAALPAARAHRPLARARLLLPGRPGGDAA